MMDEDAIPIFSTDIRELNLNFGTMPDIKAGDSVSSAVSVTVSPAISNQGPNQDGILSIGTSGNFLQFVHSTGATPGTLYTVTGIVNTTQTRRLTGIITLKCRA
jgi:hypothetical protein